MVLVLVGWVLEVVGSIGVGWLLADDMVIKGKGVTDDHRETMMMMLMIRIMTIKKRKEREKKMR